MMPTCGMPWAVDPSVIRAILNTDPVWAVYALADLAPKYSAQAEWHVAAARSALLLVYRGFDPPVLYAQGKIVDLSPLLPAIAREREFYLSVRPDFASLLRSRGYDIIGEKHMHRMILQPDRFAPRPHNAERLSLADGEALASLYADGDACGERPAFFDPAMLRHGVYYGIREGPALVAAAGTHVLAASKAQRDATPPDAVAAIGNVYTRRDRRHRGFASEVTSAVAAALLRQDIGIIALNVDETNPAARVYQRLGFTPYCAYREGLAVLNAPAAPAP